MKIKKKKASRNAKVLKEIAILREKFPSAHSKIEYTTGRTTTMVKVKPTPFSPTYTAKIVFDRILYPDVWIVSHEISDKSPHLYPGKKLCLHYPNDDSIDENSHVATSIVPWISHWLACYEIWQITGTWPAEEAPHPTGTKKEDRK